MEEVEEWSIFDTFDVTPVLAFRLLRCYINVIGHFF